MQKPRIISMIRINGTWVNQDDIPADVVAGIVEKTMKRAASNIGFEISLNAKERTA